MSHSDPSDVVAGEVSAPRWHKHYWLINAVAFQVGWFVCVLLGTPFALAYAALALVLHFGFAPVHRLDWLAVCVAVPLGVLHDNLLWHFDVLDFDAVANFGIAPIWLLCLWVLMALTFNHALQWFYNRPGWLAVMGALGGPMAYYGGVMLSGADWGMALVPALAVMLAVWCGLLPLHRWLVLQGMRLC